MSVFHDHTKIHVNDKTEKEQRNLERGNHSLHGSAGLL